MPLQKQTQKREVFINKIAVDNAEQLSFLLSRSNYLTILDTSLLLSILEALLVEEGLTT